MRRIAVLALIPLLVTGCAIGGVSGSKNASSDTELMIAFATDLSNACSTGGSQTCARARLARAYPDSLNPVKSEACISQQQDDPKYKYSILIAQDTIAEDPTWIGPQDDAPDWLFSGKVPEGKTYVMKATISTNYLGQDNTVVWDTHLTVKDGVVYWYPKIC
jgi:hypothetical protein